MASATVRKPFVGGNWKCSAKREDAVAIVERLNAADASLFSSDVFVSPSAIHMDYVVSNVRKEVIVGSQSSYAARGYGAFTGEMTPDILMDGGINWTLVGHSERRNIIGESIDLCGEKAKIALEAGMGVVFCIGEQLEQREADETMSVVTAQMLALTSRVDASAWDKIVIAYEPVWAIGTGKVATPAQAQEVHVQLREWISSNVSPEVAASVRIIYGGSVKGANCAELFALEDVDGFLVGGASLKPEFIDIIACTVRA